MSDSDLIAQLIPIARIRPDPAQPRRLLPPDLQQVLVAGTSAFDILVQLRSRAERNKWIREQLAELDGLAQSISDDGLMNPIRVIAEGDERYHIEEGERRWWAHHILVQQGKEQFQAIRAFVVEPSTVSTGLLRRRVAENVLRSDFTAMELARAMASRIQEIQEAEPGIKRSEVERRVGNENGMTDRRVRQFLSLLTLSLEAQELAQQARLTERALRRAVGIKEPGKQLAAVRELLQPVKKKSRAPLANPGSRQKQKRLANQHSRRIQKISRRDNASKKQRNATGNATQVVRKVFALTKTLSAKDWVNEVQTIANRRALAHLHETLGSVLEMSKQSKSED